jgi:Mn-dependent DtxR family transcriptional regulator
MHNLLFFQRFDLDKDGILTRKEMENSDKTLDPEIIEGLFLVADTDLNGRITHEEFKQISTAFGQETEKVLSKYINNHTRCLALSKHRSCTITSRDDGCKQGSTPLTARSPFVCESVQQGKFQICN